MHGSINAIPSKAFLHRELICAAFSDEITIIECSQISRDVRATMNCLEAMGAEILRGAGNTVNVRPISSLPEGEVELHVGESGSTLRFLLPVVCAMGIDAKVVMEGRLPKRPVKPLLEELERHGACFVEIQSYDSCLGDREERITGIIHIKGRKLSGGAYVLSGNVTSQFISGMLMALPVLKKYAGVDAWVEIEEPLESAGYVDITLAVMEMFGVERGSLGWLGGKSLAGRGVPGGYVSPCCVRVEGDWSNGAFWIVGDLLSRARYGEEGRVCVEGLEPKSVQGDRAVLELASRILSEPKPEIDVKNVPDLYPALAVLAAAQPKDTVFTGVERLRLKESDRIKSVEALLGALGVGSEYVENQGGGFVVIHGSAGISTGVAFEGGCEVDSFNDHRIAMSAAIAGIACKEPLKIKNPQCVAKSYPEFWEDYKSLGGVSFT